MPGAAEALVLVLAMIAALGLLLRAILTGLPTVTHAVPRCFWCPFRAENVTAVFEEDAWGRTRLAVKRCSAFDPDAGIACERLCLRLESLPPIRLEAA